MQPKNESKTKSMKAWLQNDGKYEKETKGQGIF